MEPNVVVSIILNDYIVHHSRNSDAVPDGLKPCGIVDVAADIVRISAEGGCTDDRCLTCIVDSGSDGHCHNEDQSDNRPRFQRNQGFSNFQSQVDFRPCQRIEDLSSVMFMMVKSCFRVIISLVGVKRLSPRKNELASKGLETQS